MVWGIFKSDSVSEAYKKMKAKELKGDQHKLDVNKNGKVDGEDLAKLRAQKEEVENVEEGWDDMLKYAKEKNGPQPNGGAGKKQGTRYGGGKQKDDEAEKRKEKNESVELELFDDEAFYDGSDMLGEAQARYSSSYQFTHKPGDEESEKKLSDLKKSVKGTDKRVVLQGRLGKNNPNAHKYSKANWGKPGSASSGGHTHQRIKKADAAHHDVYVYDKADTQYDLDTLIQEAVGTSAKYADKKGLMGDKYTAVDRMMDMKNYDKVRAQRLAQKKAEHEKQDPKTAKAGYAKHMVDTHKAEKKAAKRGVDASHLNWKHRNGVVSGKLPEDYTEQDLDTLINEVLSKDASAGEWISDFVHSDNPKFAGKSKEKRKEMALAAYYGAQKNESTDYESFIELDEEADLVKSGSKQIKHANVKDKQDDQDTMEPRAQGERDFLDKLSVNITDDPAKDGVNTGASKVSHASEPKGQGAGKYDAKEKLGKQGVKEAADCGSETKGKKTFRKFKAETRG